MDCLLTLLSDVYAMGLEHPFAAAVVMALSSAFVLGGR